MDCYLIFERHGSQYSSIQFLYLSPESVPVSLLRFTFQGILENSNAPFLLDARTFSQHFLFEIVSKIVYARPSRNSAFPWEGLAFEPTS